MTILDKTYKIHCKPEEDSFEARLPAEAYSNVAEILSRGESWIDFGDRILRVENIIKIIQV